jgi:hypothetical protein
VPVAEGARASRRLPRVPHAERPREGERIFKRSGADLQNGWLGRHGDLYLCEERLVFVPTLMDTVLQAKRREIPLDDIVEIERFPVRPGEMPAGGRRPRMLIHTAGCVYEFMVGDLDAWIDTFERVYQIRAKRGITHAPTITREGYVNVLLSEE